MHNHILAELLPTEYCTEPHLVITIDGVPLDQLLVDATDNATFLGLIPAWLDDLSDTAERKVVWDRIQQPAGTNSNVPLLMCPDDLDLSCTVVIGDTTFTADIVTWHALGLNAVEPDSEDASIGSEVNWLPGVGPFQFSRADYDACVAKFRSNIGASGP